LANVDHVLGDEQREHRRLIGEMLDAWTGPVIVTSSVAGADLGTSRALVRIAWDVADTAQRAALWSRAVARIGSKPEGDLAALAHRYRVGPAAIDRAVASVQLLHAGANVVTEGELVAGLRHNIAERLAGLATRVEVTQTWDDLVIADDIR